MKVGSKGRHVVTILIELAMRDYEEPVAVHDIADSVGVSQSYMEQILRRLKANDLVVGLRGPGGGYQLTRMPNEISIAEIITAAEGEAGFDDVDIDEVIDNDANTAGQIWSSLSGQIYDFLNNLTLGDFVKSKGISGVVAKQDEHAKRLNFVLPRPVAF